MNRRQFFSRIGLALGAVAAAGFARPKDRPASRRLLEIYRSVMRGMNASILPTEIFVSPAFFDMLESEQADLRRALPVARIRYYEASDQLRSLMFKMSRVHPSKVHRRDEMTFVFPGGMCISPMTFEWHRNRR